MRKSNIVSISEEQPKLQLNRRMFLKSATVSMLGLLPFQGCGRKSISVRFGIVTSGSRAASNVCLIAVKSTLGFDATGSSEAINPSTNALVALRIARSSSLRSFIISGLFNRSEVIFFEQNRLSEGKFGNSGGSDSCSAEILHALLPLVVCMFSF